jgi:hypothetical protein
MFFHWFLFLGEGRTNEDNVNKKEKGILKPAVS